jgi:hypothetical protein
MIIVLVGAEGCQELRDMDWAREATSEELKMLKMRLGEEQYKRLSVDDSGRPYWPMVISEEAPEHKKARAQQYDRVMRL